MFSPKKTKINPAGYGELDPFWKAVIDFLLIHLDQDARLIVPEGMTACFPDQGLAYNTAPTGKYDWLVLHKGMLSDPLMKAWVGATGFMEPVFANEVFVVFTKQGRLNPVSPKDIHYQSFLDCLNSEFSKPPGTETGMLTGLKDVRTADAKTNLDATLPKAPPESGKLQNDLENLNLMELELEQPLTPALVRMAFLLILGQPATKLDVDSNLPLKTTGALREALLRLPEFRTRWGATLSIPRPTTDDIKATKTIFFHIPKTGGTTLHEYLKPCFEPDQICPERFDALHLYNSGDLAKYRFFSGHFGIESCALIPGPKRIITMLRHPVSRLVSQYNFMRAHTEEYIKRHAMRNADLARRHNMAEYFSLKQIRNHASVNNYMTRLLSSSTLFARWLAAPKTPPDGDLEIKILGVAKENLRSLVAFGILERYQESAEWIFHALGFPKPASIEPQMVLKKLVGTASSIDRTAKPQVCDKEALELMAPLVKLDLELYNYALELFEKNIKALKSAGKSAPLSQPGATMPAS